MLKNNQFKLTTIPKQTYRRTIRKQKKRNTKHNNKISNKTRIPTRTRICQLQGKNKQIIINHNNPSR
jgi:hypothetical protein